MKKIILFSLLISLIQSTFSQNNVAYQDTIPFRNDLGLIVIPITFNGVEKQFAFDTGATSSVAYGWAKKELKSTKKSLNITSSSGLKSRMRFYKSGFINLGSRKIRGHRILNTPKNKVFSCYNIDGILGVDIIKEFNWTIDFAKKILIMYPPNHFPKKLKEMHELEFKFPKNRPYVFLKLKNNKLRFLLDTGAGGFSNISKKDYNLTNIDDYRQLSMQSASIGVNGILTSSPAKTIQFPEVFSKQISLKPIINYNNQKSSKIGNKLWEATELFLSLKKKKLYNSELKFNESYSGYSCSVMFYKDKMRIVQIQENSILWNKGVRQGDEIISFNGKKYSDFCSLDKYRRKLAKAGKSFEIELLNGEKFIVSKKSYF